MPAVLHICYFLVLILRYLLEALIWVVVANAVVSWLVAFNVINLRNPTAYSVVRMLDRICAPFLAPFRRFIPPIGGMDLTPMLLIIVIIAAQRALVQPLAQWLMMSMNGGVTV
jgi:YggT family protein